MGRLHCGVDLGSTNLKVALIDADGRCVAVRTRPTPRTRDAFGLVTDARHLLRTLEDLIVEALASTRGDEPLASIACAGVGEDGIGVDADLAPTGFSIPWFDKRAEEIASAFDADGASGVLAGAAVDFSRTASKWLWLKAHRPRELTSARGWIALTDYPAAAWTGNPFMSQTLAPRTACYDVYDRRWIQARLDAAGAPPLPGLLAAGSVVGPMKAGRLRESGAADDRTIVAAGGHDHPVAAWMVRQVHCDACVDSLGTANLCYAETTRLPTPRFDPYLAFSEPVDGGAGLACLGVFEFSDAVAQMSNLSGILSGERLPGSPAREPPLPRPRGIAAAGDIRAGLDACSLFARRMMAAARKAGAPNGPIVATGGWARSAALMEQRASVFGQPVIVIDEPELTAVSAAVLGARAAGIDLPLAAVGKSHVVDPVPAWREAYAEIYPGFSRRLDAMVAARTASVKM